MIYPSAGSSFYHHSFITAVTDIDIFISVKHTPIPEKIIEDDTF